MLGSLSVLQRDEEARRGCVKGEARIPGTPGAWKHQGPAHTLTLGCQP